MNNSTADIRQKFLDFFHSKGHQIVASSSLISNNDNTLMFTNAGMNQFKDVFLGLDTRLYQRATTAQRCVRAGGKHNDLEHVGYTTRHHTFFEMLGNFSFGEYFKYDAIQFAWELLTGKHLFNIPKEKLLVTVYATDNEAYNIWAKDIGMPAERIIRISDHEGSSIYDSDNFWQMGDIGPCGPCSEIFYDHGDHIFGRPPGSPGSKEESGDRYIEIWNLVFVQFNRQADGTMLPLSKPSVDTGMGLERIAAVLQQVNSNYEIDIFSQLIKAAAEVTCTTNICSTSLRVIADHIRSCAFLISEGIVPSKDGRGYVLRHIIRRAIRHGYILGATHPFFYKLVTPLIEIMGNAAEQLQRNKNMIELVLRNEEEQFSHTLERGLSILEHELAHINSDTMDGATAFRLYDTYGFPLYLTVDVCRERNINVDQEGFKKAMEVQRKRARETSSFIGYNHNNQYSSMLNIAYCTNFLGYENVTYHNSKIMALFCDGKPVEVIDSINNNNNLNSIVILNETPFYGESGGQIGDSGELKSDTGIFKVFDTKKYGQSFCHIGTLSYGKLSIGDKVIAYVNKARRTCISLNHSATHLLQSALRNVLENNVEQRGSIVKDKYLRFDFSHNKALENEQIRIVEEIVNKHIRSNLIINTTNMSIDAARQKGYLLVLGEQYHQSKVRVLSIGNVSTELCCGTHASRTGDIGLFLILSESGIAAGIRRIEAVTGEAALACLHQQKHLLQSISQQLLKNDGPNLIEKVRSLKDRTKKLEQQLNHINNQQVVQEIAKLSSKIRKINGAQVIVSQLENIDQKILRTIVENMKNKLGSAVIILANISEMKANLIAGVTGNLTNSIKAKDIISTLTQKVGGKGGGSPEIAYACCSDITAIPAALSHITIMITEKLLTKNV
ncbi:alanine--tRNA ligase [Candidatus Palibaumannia cicadellinicola]|uniref:alanine--tRNA ligase n=1 Tax=Candidatus Palibaumannia cicadellinicola TaxID=186490 RepID=UPI00069DB0FE|nr:alanine--tRNA ligase [Candidatus Baumannia cicadellinicola]